MRIVVAVHGRFHGFDLARELRASNHLSALMTTYPAFIVHRHLDGPKLLATAPWLEFYRRLCQSLGGICSDPNGAVAASFGRFIANKLPDKMDLLVGWSSVTFEAIAPAHTRGARVVLERGSTHISHQTEVLTEVYGRHGGTFNETSARIIERELAEYEAADSISVPSNYAAETFKAYGIAKEKLFINPYGVDLQQFSPPSVRDHLLPRIVFVGQVGYRKGIPELLKAFAPIADVAELHLIGPVAPACEEISGHNVFVRGPLPMSLLPTEYAAADIFCLPSWEEGFPLVLLQAMAAGLPVVATLPTGAADIITPGKDGEILAAGDINALTAALKRLVEEPERRQAFGVAARNRVSAGFGWEDYGNRAISHYRRLLSAN